jgi:hypothetical protein
MWRVAAWAATLVLAAFPAWAESHAITLAGEISRLDHQSYLEVPFRVPPGATSVSVSFTHTGREDRTVIDLGLRDPERLRGWSGGNKSAFTLSETWATPSYLPGPLRPAVRSTAFRARRGDGVRAGMRATCTPIRRTLTAAARRRPGSERPAR